MKALHICRGDYFISVRLLSRAYLNGWVRGVTVCFSFFVNITIFLNVILIYMIVYSFVITVLKWFV